MWVFRFSSSCFFGLVAMILALFFSFADVKNGLFLPPFPFYPPPSLCEFCLLRFVLVALITSFRPLATIALTLFVSIIVFLNHTIRLASPFLTFPIGSFSTIHVHTSTCTHIQMTDTEWIKTEEPHSSSRSTSPSGYFISLYVYRLPSSIFPLVLLWLLSLGLSICTQKS